MTKGTDNLNQTSIRLSSLFKNFINQTNWETSLEGGFQVTQFFRKMISCSNIDVPYNRINKGDLYLAWEGISNMINTACSATQETPMSLVHSARDSKQALQMIEQGLTISISFFVDQILQNWEIVGKSNHTYKTLSILADSYSYEPSYMFLQFDDDLEALEKNLLICEMSHEH